VLTAALSIYFLYRTLKEGQKQANESNELTKQNLSISQYQIYMEEMKYFINLFQNLKFAVNPNALPGTDFQTNISNYNGIDYIELFGPVMGHHNYFTTMNEIPFNKRVNEFRHNIIFPLFRKYSQLHNYLERIKADSVLKVDHKKLLYLLIERDILQTYFRICNNEDPLNQKSYNLSTFDTPVFQSNSFYDVNQFYIDNSLFSLHSLKFYKETL
jgi:hypothetical protein